MSSVCEAWEVTDPVDSRAFRIGAAIGAGSDILVGDQEPSARIEARWQMGNDRPPDMVWSTAGDIVLLSERTQAALTRAGCSGWRAWPVSLIGKDGGLIRGYSALAVTGRAGPADYSSAKVVWRAFPGGRYPYLTGCWFREESWDGSDFFMERPAPGHVQTQRIYASDRAAAALRGARVKNVGLEKLVDRQVSAMIFSDEVRGRWPAELRQEIERGPDAS